jgi:hypothetical protein
MRTDAFIGNLILCGLLTPAIAWLVLRLWGGPAGVKARDWLLIYGLAALLYLAVLPRKHIEVAILRRWPHEYWAATLTVIDNEWWEELAKLLVLLIVLWLAGGRLRSLFTHKRPALVIGYWAGLCYGIAEAVTLAALFVWPQWASIFGIKTFTPYMVGWAFVRERLWAVHIHAVMGALIGLGLYGLIGLKSRGRFVAFFILAMLYHHLVDGLIATAAFAPDLAAFMQKAGERLVPSLLVVGFVVLCLAYRAAGSGRLSNALITDERASTTPQKG